MPKARYGTHHQRVRAALLPAAIGQPCPFCGEVMRADQELHLDHGPGGRYRMAHGTCNVLDGARRGYRRMLESRGVPRGGVF